MARLRDISARLRRTLYTKEAYNCMPVWARHWSDGGCRTLQRAVLEWLGDSAQPWGLFPPDDFWQKDSQPENATHVGCVINGRYWLDGEGICPIDKIPDGDLWQSWLVLRPIGDLDCEKGFVNDPSAVKSDTLPELVSLLERCCGNRDEFLARLPRRYKKQQIKMRQIL